MATEDHAILMFIHFNFDGKKVLIEKDVVCRRFSTEGLQEVLKFF
jgi:hypothetical protein